MKIMHGFFTMETGGAQVLAVDLMNEQVREHEVSLLVVNNKWTDALLKQLDPRIRIYRIGRQEGSRNPLPILRLNLLLWRIRPDAIHCHEPKLAQLFKLRGPKLVFTLHTTGIPEDTFPLYHSIVAISDAVKEEAQQRYRGKIATIYNGVDGRAFRRRTDFSLREGPLRMVQVSRMDHHTKGQDVLLRALALLRDQHGFSSFEMSFVGGGASMDFLKELTREVKLEDRVRFEGERNRQWLHAHLADYHLLVQPSRIEGFGLTILEGFAAGLPVLASRIAGPAEIVARTERGFLFESENADDCARQLANIAGDFASGAMSHLIARTEPLTETAYSLQACSAEYVREYQWNGAGFKQH